jgi:ferric-dicitrate binding protein FerR (iron transport regulator)
MQTNPVDPGKLIYQYLSEEMTEQDRADLDAWLQESPAHRELFATLTDPINIHQGISRQYQIAASAGPVFQKVMQGIQTQAPVRRISMLRYGWAAAAVLVVIIASTWLLLHNKSQISKSKIEHLAATIQPGSNKATLTLSDGRTIILDSTTHSITDANGAQIINLANGQLSYNNKSYIEKSNIEKSYNTLTTPKGGKYQVVLPDGSKVWLNAASSIRFPVAFNTERQVNITGEVYFEIAADKTKPFKVTVDNKSTIEVLGTSFNINAYDNEPSLNTTLIEGSVRVTNTSSNPTSKNRTSITLSPGQQSQQISTEPLLIQHADIEKVMAWKNGIFNFEGADLATVARQLSRWYDISIVLEGKLPEEKFKGKMDRALTLSQVLKILSETEVAFRMEGRTLIISGN